MSSTIDVVISGGRVAFKASTSWIRLSDGNHSPGRVTTANPTHCIVQGRVCHDL